MSRFTGKKVLVTGGNSGMGLETAKEFIREGAEVFITGRNKETLEIAQRELGPKAKALVSDSGSLKDIAALAETIKKEFGHLDAAFINAGIAHFVPLEELTEKHFDDTFNTNVKGPLFLVQKLAPLFKNGGSIILNGSVVAQKGFPNASVYSATKAAVVNLAKTLSTDLLSKGIRVNTLSPGPIETPIFARMGGTAEQTKQTQDHMATMVPLKRLGTTKEIAKTVLFLASDDSSFILGSDISVDGGVAQL
ncbi:MAG: SDR family oxidoreductase [Bdellovibrionales bacterium]|nr:SDR family oxidoreductase [Bdellovibrionales bacterium]